jgi:glycosyltransferase involved in cell wall biosynthesis
MRICLIGKFPPIQGGVSMRTYWTAHKLAARGHEVHVVTNAKEASSPFRMHMRREDWQRCEADYGTGRVSVDWTDPVDRSQVYLPMASPFVSKLSALALKAHEKKPFDVILSHYMEPYGIAGYLTSQITSVPHVVRMAGSDAGRLWHHPQLEPLYDHVLREAASVVVTGAVAERAQRRGVDATRSVAGGGFMVPEDLFTPIGPRLNFSKLSEEIEHDPDIEGQTWGQFSERLPYIGIYGKLGRQKGSFALLAALQRLKQRGIEVGLVALAHGRREIEDEFRTEVRRLGLDDRVMQIPFLPHWRVPEFLRGCLAICCLEQDFPIRHHSPIIPLEVLLCGKCLVGSTEVIRKLPGYWRLPHGYGCVAIEHVNDFEELTARLAAIVADPPLAQVVGARGHVFARELQQETGFPDRLERILAAVAAKERNPTAGRTEASQTSGSRDGFVLTRLALKMVAGPPDRQNDTPFDQPDVGLTQAKAVLRRIEGEMGTCRSDLASLAAAVRLEIKLAEAEQNTVIDADHSDPLFRLDINNWAMRDDELADLVPVRDRRLRILEFDFDVTEFQNVRTLEDLPARPKPARSYLAVFADGDARTPMHIDPTTARILHFCDGRRRIVDVLECLTEDGTAHDVDVDQLGWVEQLLVHGLIGLRQHTTTETQSGADEPRIASR